jgi:hypothetical protein
MTRRILGLLALATLGCATEPNAPELLVHLRETDLYTDSTGRVTLYPELANVGNRTAVSSYCASRPGDVAVNWSIDRWSGSEWIGRESATYVCAPPTFGSLKLAPNARYVDTLHVPLEPGMYRLRVFYRSAESPEATGSYRDSHPSRRFTVHP